MAIHKAEVVFHSGTGLPKDDITNSFHFDTGAAIFSLYSAAITDLLEAFYDDTPPGGVGSLASRWRNGIITTTVDVNFYTTTVATGLETPVGQTQFTLSSMAATGDAFPAEVAIRASVHGDLTGVASTDRQRRGGPYIGGAWLADTGFVNTGRMSVDSALVDDISRACSNLQTDAATVGYLWVVYSKAAGTTFEITGGFVDNAFDTIKRRGVEPTQRITWSA